MTRNTRAAVGWELAFTLLDKLAERLGPGQQVAGN